MLTLYTCFPKSWSEIPGDPQDLSGIHEFKAIFIIKLRCFLLFFYYINICANAAKTLVDKTVGTLLQIKAVALKSYPCEEVKNINVTNISLMFHETKWEECIKHLCCVLKYNGWLSWEKALGQSFELWVNVGTLSRNNIFYLKEWHINNDIFSGLNIWPTFLKKINEVSLSFQEKLLAVRWRSEFWKSVSATELGSFPILNDFLDEISVDINECDFLTLYNEIFHSWKIYIIQWTNISQITNAWHHKSMHE